MRSYGSRLKAMATWPCLKNETTVRNVYRDGVRKFTNASFWRHPLGVATLREQEVPSRRAFVFLPNFPN